MLDEMTGLVLARAEIAHRRMPTLAIVPDLNVFEDVLLGPLSGSIMPVMNQLPLQRRKEALYRSIVPAVSFAAHAALDAMLCQQRLVVSAGVLTTPVTVMQQPRLRPTAAHSHAHRIDHERALQRLLHRPTHDPSGEQVHRAM